MKINSFIEKLEPWSPPKHEEDCLSLDLNENYFLSEFFLKTYNINFSFCKYPDYNHLLSLIASMTETTEEHLILTNGADQAIDLVIRLCFQPTNKVVIPSPVFSYYYHVLESYGIKIISVPYIKEKCQFKFPIDSTLLTIKEADGIILCHPNNPLGIIIPEEQLLEMIQICNELEIPIIIDEAYYEYCKVTCANLIQKNSNLIIIRSFSKYFGLAGLRLGYILSTPYLIKQLLKLRGPWDVNCVATKLAEHCLTRIDEIRIIMEEFEYSKEYLLETFNALRISSFLSRANFILVQDNSEKTLYYSLKSNGIQVADLSNYPYSFNMLKNMLRITIPPLKYSHKISRLLSSEIMISS